MVTRKEIKSPKQRILTVCVQMFLEKGFKATTMLDIIREADVSSGTFQNIFRTKDGVLTELIDIISSGSSAKPQAACNCRRTPFCFMRLRLPFSLPSLS